MNIDMKWIAIGLLGVVGLPTKSVAIEKYALVIGNNQGHDPAGALEYALQDAKKMHALLKDLGGVTPSRLHLLLEASAADVHKAAEEIEAKIKKQKRSGQRTMLLLYYSGHAQEDYLELGDSSLSFADLVDYLKRSQADIRLAFLDACHSGQVASIKGGRRVDAYEIRVNDGMHASGYAIITSSTGRETSRENSRIGGSYFTHYLISALRGAGDSSGDGRVTLAEAYRYAYDQTLLRTSKTLGGAQHPMYDFRLQGQGEITLTRLRPHDSRLVVVPPGGGKLMVVDQKAQAIVAETPVDGHTKVRLWLPPGGYQLIVEQAQQLLLANAQLRSTRPVVVRPVDFVVEEKERSFPKMSGFRLDARHQIQSGFLVRKFPLAGGHASLGGVAHYRYLWDSRFGVGIRFHLAAATDQLSSEGYTELGTYLSFGLTWRIGLWSMMAELLVGADAIFQDSVLGIQRTSLGPGYLGLFSLRRSFAPIFLFAEIGAGGRLIWFRTKSTAHRFDAQFVMGLGWLWGS